MSNDEQFKYESMQDRETIVKYLNALADGLSKGAMTFSWKNETIVLHPRDLLHLAIEAKGKGDRKKIILKIAWNEREKNSGNDEPLTIGSSGQEG